MARLACPAPSVLWLGMTDGAKVGCTRTNAPFEGVHKPFGSSPYRRIIPFRIFHGQKASRIYIVCGMRAERLLRPRVLTHAANHPDSGRFAGDARLKPTRSAAFVKRSPEADAPIAMHRYTASGRIPAAHRRRSPRHAGTSPEAA